MTSAPSIRVRICTWIDLRKEEVGCGGEGKHLQKGFLLNIKDSIAHEKNSSSSGLYRLAQVLPSKPRCGL